MTNDRFITFMNNCNIGYFDGKINPETQVRDTCIALFLRMNYFSQMFKCF